MSKFVLQHQPNLMFIHFDSIDEAGHAYSWGSPQYYDAVKVGATVHVRTLSLHINLPVATSVVKNYMYGCL